MSANNWTVCPKCWEKRNKEWEAHLQKVKDSYGKIPAKEYIDLVNMKKPTLSPSFREDWDIGLYDGEFDVDYKGKCMTCPFQFKYKKTISINI